MGKGPPSRIRRKAPTQPAFIQPELRLYQVRSFAADVMHRPPAEWRETNAEDGTSCYKEVREELPTAHEKRGDSVSVARAVIVTAPADLTVVTVGAEESSKRCLDT